jgi:hypothetical protein
LKLVHHIAATALAAIAGSALTFPTSAEEAYVTAINDYVKANVLSWAADPALVDAIKAQNAANANLSQGDIDALDAKWKAEVEATDKPMISSTLGNPVSKFLAEKKRAAGGLITEVFVMDDKGLNVGQSDVTSDYWQGDEAKFQKSFGAGADAVFVDEIEKDESTQTLQSQVSLTIKDPASGAPIGAITLGIDVEKF